MNKQPGQLLESSNFAHDLHYHANTSNYPAADTEAKTCQQTSLISEDELLTLLAGAYENLRAQQIFEWEAIRRHAEMKAAARYYTH